MRLTSARQLEAALLEPQLSHQQSEHVAKRGPERRQLRRGTRPAQQVAQRSASLSRQASLSTHAANSSRSKVIFFDTCILYIQILSFVLVIVIAVVIAVVVVVVINVYTTGFFCS